MFKNFLDTIVAISTPKGIGAIGIVRLSGPKSLFIAEVLTKKKIKDNVITRSKFYLNNSIIDFGLVLYFKKPKSFTGEDIVEFHTHGSEVILNSLLLEAINLTARLAEPGEFSFRAYLNGKLDLIQVEAINSLINSNFTSNNLSIVKSLIGIFSKDIKYILNSILLLRRDLEAFLNFPDSVYFDESHFINNFILVKNRFFSLFEKINFNNVGCDFLKISIVGNANVGKSSLFNFLIKNKRSIVSNVAGTTRDFIEEKYKINENFFLNLVDTAGFKIDFTSNLDKNTILKTFEQIKKSSLIIYMFDVTENKSAFEDKIFTSILKNFKNKKFIIVYNKIDLVKNNSNFLKKNNIPEFYVSVKSGNGLSDLISYINLNFSLINNDFYIIDKKFAENFIKLKLAFLNSEKILNASNLDILADFLKVIYDDLSIIIGRDFDDDIIKKIFSNFCLGK